MLQRHLQRQTGSSGAFDQWWSAIQTSLGDASFPSQKYRYLLRDRGKMLFALCIPALPESAPWEEDRLLVDSRLLPIHAPLATNAAAPVEGALMSRSKGRGSAAEDSRGADGAMVLGMHLGQ